MQDKQIFCNFSIVGRLILVDIHTVSRFVKIDVWSRVLYLLTGEKLFSHSHVTANMQPIHNETNYFEKWLSSLSFNTHDNVDGLLVLV